MSLELVGKKLNIELCFPYCWPIFNLKEMGDWDGIFSFYTNTGVKIQKKNHKRMKVKEFLLDDVLLRGVWFPFWKEFSQIYTLSDKMELRIYSNKVHFVRINIKDLNLSEYFKRLKQIDGLEVMIDILGNKKILFTFGKKSLDEKLLKLFQYVGKQFKDGVMDKIEVRNDKICISFLKKNRKYPTVLIFKVEDFEKVLKFLEFDRIEKILEWLNL